MDKIINQVAEENQNPALRQDIIADIWNSPLGKAFDSPEEIDKALSDESMPAVSARARQFMGLPVIE
jgi:hypothetical protein